MWPEIEVRFLPKTRLLMKEDMRWEHPLPCVVPSGFVSDGGTIPAPAWALVGHPFSYSMLALYLIHDYELSLGVPWMEAAARLRVRMKARRISYLRRSLIGVSVTVYAFFKQYC